MAKIYKSPIEEPVIDFTNGRGVQDYQNDCAKFKDDLREWLKKNGLVREHAGKVIKFPVADSYAEYMVADVEKAMLIHLKLGDEWHFEFAHLLTSTEILEKIQQQEAMAKFFTKK